MLLPRIHLIILSLGLGIQSTTMALLLERGLLPGVPRPDYGIFADTFAEPPHVYETREWLRELVSFPIVTCSFGDIARNTWKAITGQPVPERGHHKAGYIDVPVFSESGIGRRQCTGVYKIRPIKAEIRRLAGSKPPALTATQYLGFSTNEARRAKPNKDAWLTNRFPLLEHGWSRTDCLQFLDRNYPGHPVRRSACYLCPYRNQADWLELKELYPHLYQDAVAMDRQMAEHPRGPWRLRQGGLERSLAAQEAQMSFHHQLTAD